jgi:acetyl-CoA synthetase
VVSVADSFSAAELAKRMEIAGARAVVTVQAYRRAGREIALYPRVREALEGIADAWGAIVLGAGRLETGDVAGEDFLAPRGGAEGHVDAPEHVTNVLFSSGTTGTPKAIPWTALTPMKCGLDAHLHHDVHPGDVVCWPTNVGWMMGPWLIYGSLLNDAAMALYEGAPTGEGFARFVGEAGVTMLGVVPSMARGWRATEAVRPGAWAGVRVFSSTGEASNPEDYLWLMSLADYRAPVIEYLGGTEIGGGHITGTVLQPASPATFTTPALGIDVALLDEDDQVVSEGEGELFLVPPALGLSQTLLNADHHAVYYQGCPSGPGGQVLRRHGDQMARLPGGYYRARGRADDTMNLGGIKVSSVELERVVGEHPAVYESAAVGVPSPGGGADRLVVFVVAARAVDQDELRQELQGAIAKALNPLFRLHDVEVVEALPRTASNKIMRRELRARYHR